MSLTTPGIASTDLINIYFDAHMPADLLRRYNIYHCQAIGDQVLLAEATPSGPRIFLADHLTGLYLLDTATLLQGSSLPDSTSASLELINLNILPTGLDTLKANPLLAERVFLVDDYNQEVVNPDSLRQQAFRQAEKAGASRSLTGFFGFLVEECLGGQLEVTLTDLGVSFSTEVGKDKPILVRRSLKQASQLNLLRVVTMAPGKATVQFNRRYITGVDHSIAPAFFSLFFY
ncbi:hypothetical protein [Hymenobacter guriensis]|uniref:Uncharacterized protein n=1 Tax=Hymenobacter guriensis TaxID=2793065 RepID=A0ABS0L4F5_9BACT|nr:hypothetical protein [Hymenobacter guriensis]MBG8555007.1 hypothetical protein [Hymenobacter guriensis]